MNKTSGMRTFQTLLLAGLLFGFAALGPAASHEAGMDPDAALKKLMDGNRRFVKAENSAPKTVQSIRAAISKALWTKSLLRLNAPEIFRVMSWITRSGKTRWPLRKN